MMHLVTLKQDYLYFVKSGPILLGLPLPASPPVSFRAPAIWKAGIPREQDDSFAELRVKKKMGE